MSVYGFLFFFRAIGLLGYLKAFRVHKGLGVQGL